ncbi:hypothetical protein BC833DRAFT_583614 [Globomyces pollinis-pini]|nr:hypothetical protein BC833DRAFT_583614 [Globomyces pollinis-pini]
MDSNKISMFVLYKMCGFFILTLLSVECIHLTCEGYPPYQIDTPLKLTKNCCDWIPENENYNQCLPFSHVQFQYTIFWSVSFKSKFTSPKLIED